METQRLSQAQRKEIAALKSTRHRRASGLFLVEGTRALMEALPVMRCRQVVATAQWLDENGARLRALNSSVLVAKPEDIDRMADSATPQGVVGVFEMPALQPDVFEAVPGELVLALDCIQDPGNLGTIVRLADWFGITKIWASPDTADVYSPKVVRSTMGAVARVRVAYTPLVEVISRAAGDGVPVYGTFLDGADIYTADLTPGGIIVMGNEGNGISDAVAEVCTRRLRIPSFPPGRPTVESLNVGVATAITVSQFRQHQIV